MSGGVGAVDTGTGLNIPERFDKPGTDGSREYKKCDGKSCLTGLKWTVIALAIIGVIVGVVGGLVCWNVIQLSLTAVGTMSAMTGLYVMLAGGVAALIITALLIVSCVLNRSKAASESTEAKSGCFSCYGNSNDRIPDEELGLSDV